MKRKKYYILLLMLFVFVACYYAYSQFEKFSNKKELFSLASLPKKIDRIEINVHLFDCTSKQFKSNYPCELKYIDGNGTRKSEQFQTDSSGKFIFTTTMIGQMYLQIYTKDYAIFSKTIRVGYGYNKLKASLYLGGILEIRVVDENNKNIPDLSAKHGNNDESFSVQDFQPLEFDISKGVYLMPNLPLSKQFISFKSKYYHESPHYKINVDPVSPTQIQIKLKPLRKLIFNIDIENKPDFIQIANEGGFSFGYFIEDIVRKIRIKDEKTFKNDNQLFEFFLDDQYCLQSRNDGGGITEYFVSDQCNIKLMIHVDNFASQLIEIIPQQNEYKVKLTKGIVGNVQLVNEKGSPVVGAKVICNSSEYYNTLFTDKEGLVFFEGLRENNYYFLTISHPEYGVLDIHENWTIESKESNFHKIVLKNEKRIIGKIKFNGKVVVGAKVVLFGIESRGEEFCAESDVDSEGNYYFYKKDDDPTIAKSFLEKLKSMFEKKYIIRAYHPLYGTGNSKVTQFKKGIQNINLNLVKSNSIIIKLLDEHGAPLPDKKLTILNSLYASSISDNIESFSEHRIGQLYLNFKTNSKGEFEVFNLKPGPYEIFLDDDKLKLKNTESYGRHKFIAPLKILELKTEEIELVKVGLTLPNGEMYKGPLNFTEFIFDNTFDSFKDINGINYIKCSHLFYNALVLNIESLGYPLIQLGPYESKTSFPKEFNLKLDESQNLLVKVVDLKSNQPIPFVTVDIILEGFSFSYHQVKDSVLESLPTNEKGEILFRQLKGKLKLVANVENYAPFEKEFDCSKTKELIVKLSRGGKLKGHFTPNKKADSTELEINSNSTSLSVQANGNFELANISPGEYSFIMKTNYLNDGKYQEIVPGRLVVENEKTFEVDFDAIHGYKSALEVDLLIDGKLFSSRGILRVRDSIGRLFFMTDSTSNGKYFIKDLFPGVYQLWFYNDSKKFDIVKSIIVKPNQKNLEVIDLVPTLIYLKIKNEEGVNIDKLEITAYVGEMKQQIEPFGVSRSSSFEDDLSYRFSLLPKTPYYFVVDGNINSNYQMKVIGPIELAAGENKTIEYILPYGRKLPKIQIVDFDGSPLQEAVYIISENNGRFLQRSFSNDYRQSPYSNKKGFLPENGWPLDQFKLMVFREGYEFKEIVIRENINPEEVLQIKLNKASSLQCNLSQLLSTPISIGILNDKSELLEKPVLYYLSYQIKRFFYYTSMAFGSVRFSDLPAGTYYIGYFENGSTKLISKQGPFTIGVEENLVVTSTYK